MQPEVSHQLLRLYTECLLLFVAQIPENLARFAVKAGMGGFVKKMGPAVVKFVAERRTHADPVRPLASGATYMVFQLEEAAA